MITDREFESFATAASPTLFRTAWLLTGDWYFAEDLVQETLARMYKAWPTPINHPIPYARAALVRLFLSHRRRRSSTERPSDSLPEVAIEGADADLRRVVVDALLTLPERDRAVVVLRYLADRSVADVAGDLGRSQEAVRIQCHRALAKLRLVLGDSIHDLMNP